MNDKQPTDPQLQRLYREHATQEPSSAADRRILEAARRACEPSRSRRTWLRWKIPLSVAATVLLAFSIVSQLDMKNTPTIKDQVASSESAAKAQIAPPANVSELPADRRAERKKETTVAAEAVSQLPTAEASASGRDATGSARLAAMPAAAPASPFAGGKSVDGDSVPAPVVPMSPQEWLERIRTLQKEGKTEESAKQLAEFVAAYPAYVLPEDLKSR